MSNASGSLSSVGDRRGGLSGRSRRRPSVWVESPPMPVTIREFIDRRRDRVKIVVVPLLLAALGMLLHGGKHGPWTSVNSIGAGVALLGGIVYVAYVGTIRCPGCRGFIGLNIVSPTRRTPPPTERCVHCGLSFGKSMDTPRE
jgi:hypothetical protein